ncbi:hypothetical protein ACFSCX_19515 [Bacillus salitolerans]|uniref:DUF3139 domain-containing protein n=1 Tax=Bacillus salitolerans TaxID=1437434 RepID=A0ABW4LUG5_9BACI
MKRKIILLITITIMIGIATYGYYFYNIPQKGKGFTKMTIYLNWDKEGPYVITDREVINTVIDTINSGSRKNISKIIFEEGPDGRIIFSGKKKGVEVGVFSNGGNVVTDKYYIITGLNLDEIINKNN